MLFTNDSHGNIIGWSSADGTPILYPITVHRGGVVRGRSHICYPFGLADDDFPEGTPQHGGLRDGTGCSESGYEELSENATLAESTRVFTARDVGGFEDHSVIIKATVDPREPHTLMHQISMHAHGPTNCLVPISLGMHWYFATHGSDFSVVGAGNQPLSREKIDDLKGELFIWIVPQDSTSLWLRTCNGTIQVTCVAGYNEFVVWTGQSRKYICMEPVTGRLRKERKYLDSGERFDAVCRLDYTPH